MSLLHASLMIRITGTEKIDDNLKYFPFARLVFRIGHKTYFFFNANLMNQTVFYMEEQSGHGWKRFD
jgi:hypothetical protein